jgi:phage-related protein
MAAANTVKVTFLGDSASLRKATADARGEVDKFSKGIGGAKKIIGGFALAGGVAGAFSFAKGLIADAQESAKVMRLSENVIRSTGGAAKVTAAQVSDLATAISNKTGVDDEAVQSGENLLLTFTNIRNEAGKNNDIFNQASKAAVDMAAGLNNGDVSAESLKGTSIQLGKALNDPVKGITALSRSGVSFTEQQKKQITAMVKAGDTLGAQKIILGELKKEFGGAAAAASTPAQKATVAWGNLREQLGSYLLPVVAKVATFLSTKVIPAISKFAEGIHSGSGGFATFRAAISNAFEYIRTTILPLLQRFGNWFIQTGWPAIKRFASAFWRDLQPALASAKQAFDQQLRPAIEKMIAKFREAWPTIQRVLVILGQIAQFIMTKVVPVLIQFYAKYLATVIRVFAQMFATGWKVIGFLIDLGKSVGQAGAAFGRFVGKVAGAMAGAYNAVKSGVGKAVEFVKGMPGRLVSAIGNLGRTLYSAGLDLIQGFINGIKDKAGDILSTIKNSVTDKIPGWIKKPLGISSPSKLTREYGQNVSEGLALGIADKAAQIKEAAQSMVDKLKDKLTEVKDFARDIRSQFRDLGDVTNIDTMLTDANGNQTQGGFGALLDGLKKKAADAQKFAQAMKTLRKQGLNQATLDQLRQAGPDGGLAAAQNLVAGGMGGVGQVNALMAQISKIGTAFAAGEARRQFGIGPNAGLSGAEAKVIFDVRGGEDDLKRLIRKWIRAEGGNVQKVLGSL